MSSTTLIEGLATTPLTMKTNRVLGGRTTKQSHDASHTLAWIWIWPEEGSPFTGIALAKSAIGSQE